tara:strand:- start:197 stop:931 length:735 start_codon:yes stop_codon:yes gene_type:complete
MTNAELQIKVKERLNKLASLDYDNFECWQIVEAFNKAQLEWIRRQVVGANQLQSGEGSTKVNYDDLQRLVKTVTVLGTTNTSAPASWTSISFDTLDPANPKDYLYYSSVYVTANDQCCPNVDRNIIVYMVDKADLYVILRDENKKPSFEWGETVGILSDNKLTIYTDNQFQIDSVNMTYYRKPIPVEFQNCINVSTGQATGDVPCEFKDDVAEILVDNAVAILAADIESFNQYTRATNSVQNNT